MLENQEVSSKVVLFKKKIWLMLIWQIMNIRKKKRRDKHLANKDFHLKCQDKCHKVKKYQTEEWGKRLEHSLELICEIYILL